MLFWIALFIFNIMLAQNNLSIQLKALDRQISTSCKHCKQAFRTINDYPESLELCHDDKNNIVNLKRLLDEENYNNNYPESLELCQDDNIT